MSPLLRYEQKSQLSFGLFYCWGFSDLIVTALGLFTLAAYLQDAAAYQRDWEFVNLWMQVLKLLSLISKISSILVSISRWFFAFH